MKPSTKVAFWFVFILLIIDQASKIYIKTNFYLGEYLPIFEWFEIRFIENNGMAFGFEFGGDIGKVFLTLVRIGAIVFVVRWLRKVIRKTSPKPLYIALMFVLAGAIGNVIDGMFYGLFFNESYGQVASFLPESGGYANLFFGRVVDMLYFPLIDTHLPDWLPIWGGKRFTFFDPIFNMADVYISTGFCILLLWNKTCFPKQKYA